MLLLQLIRQLLVQHACLAALPCTLRSRLLCLLLQHQKGREARYKQQSKAHVSFPSQHACEQVNQDR
jgi:hypothetical protein